MRRLIGIVSRLAVVGGLSVLVAGAVGAAQAQESGQVMLDVDAPDAGTNIANGQRVLIGGWAVAPGAAISSVDVYLDSPQGGAPVGSARLGIVRRDVATSLGHPEWGASGYTLDWVPQNLSQGEHTLYIVAHTTSGQTATQAVQVSGCGCGLRGSVTNPIVTGLGSYGYELDTGGPGVWLERPADMPPSGN